MENLVTLELTEQEVKVMKYLLSSQACWEARFEIEDLYDANREDAADALTCCYQNEGAKSLAQKLGLDLEKEYLDTLAEFNQNEESGDND